MMKITGLSHLFKWENLRNWWLTKYFFAPMYMVHTMKVSVILNPVKYRYMDKNHVSMMRI